MTHSIFAPCFASLAATLLVACAGAEPQGDAARDRLACDQSRMDAVERVALRQGTELHWVNCPRPAAGERAIVERRP